VLSVQPDTNFGSDNKDYKGLFSFLLLLMNIHSFFNAIISSLIPTIYVHHWQPKFLSSCSRPFMVHFNAGNHQCCYTNSFLNDL